MQPFDWLEKLDACEICYSCYPLFQSNWIISVRTCPAALLVSVIKSHKVTADKTPQCSMSIYHCNYCGRPIATPWVQIVNCTFLHKKTLAGSNVKVVSFSFEGIKYCTQFTNVRNKKSNGIPLWEGTYIVSDNMDGRESLESNIRISWWTKIWNLLLLCILKAKIKLITTTNSLWPLKSPVKLPYVFTSECGNTTVL